MSQLFPGQDVTIDSRCPQSGDPIQVRMRGVDLLTVTPESTIGHSNQTIDQLGTPSWAFT